MVCDKALEMWCHMMTLTYVVAFDMNDAVHVLADNIGESESSFASDVWQGVPADKVIRVREDGTDAVESKTAAEWIVAEGRGVLCSAELV